MTDRKFQSKLMSSYNKYKAYMRRTGQDTKRVDRAFGICQSKYGIPRMHTEYHTDHYNCECKDMEFWYSNKRKNQNGDKYHGYCKHMNAVILMDMVQDLDNRR